jgi:ABC-type lipoprotein release transport system permease subunit
MMLLKMAWLNIWRNPRRTVLLLCAVVVGVAGVIFCMGFMNGWLDSMIVRAVRTYEGHVKIVGKGFNENPIVENNMAPPVAIEKWLEQDGRVLAWTERVAVQGLISSARHSATVRIVGIDPAREAEVSIVAEKLVDGRFLEEGDRLKVVVGRRLLEKFHSKVGRRLVVLSQQLGGEVGSGAFKIVGVFDTGNGGFDESTVYVMKEEAQSMLDLGDRITEVVAVLQHIDDSEDVAAAVRAQLPGAGDDVEVLTWRDLLPFVVKSMELNDKTMIIFYGIFYLAMAFGILNTLLMSIGERAHEFGVMLAMGMKRRLVFGVILIESCCISAIATAIGTVVGYALVSFYGENGMDLGSFSEAMEFMQMDSVLYLHVTASNLANAAIATFIVAIVFSIYPAVRAARMAPVQALRHVR